MASKRRVRSWNLILLMLVAALAAYWLFPSLSEPQYRGRKLSDCLEVYVHESNGRVSYSGSLATGEPIRAMGTNAVPFLLRRIQAHDSAASRLRRFLSRNQSIIKVKYVSAETLRQQAFWGFLCLGPGGETAIPELARLLGQPETAPYAARSLGVISPKAVPALLRALDNNDPLIRREAAYGLGGGLAAPDPGMHGEPRLGTNVSTIIPALLRAAKDTNAVVRAAALHALAAMLRRPELKEGLADPAEILSREIPPPTVSEDRKSDPDGMRVMLSTGIGQIFYTLDGSDPRLPGGAISPRAVCYKSPFTLSNGFVSARVIRDSNLWSALVYAGPW